MSLTPEYVLYLLMRWIHIASAVLLVGSFAYARLVAVPALQAVSPHERVAAWEQIAARFRPLLYATIAGVLVSGLYNLFKSGAHSVAYNIGFAVKALLAAHIFAAALMTVKPPTGKPGDEARRARQMTGVLISGLVVILIATLLGRVIY